MRLFLVTLFVVVSVSLAFRPRVNVEVRKDENTTVGVEINTRKHEEDKKNRSDFTIHTSFNRSQYDITDGYLELGTRGILTNGTYTKEDVFYQANLSSEGVDIHLEKPLTDKPLEAFLNLQSKLKNIEAGLKYSNKNDLEATAALSNNYFRINSTKNLTDGLFTASLDAVTSYNSLIDFYNISFKTNEQYQNMNFNGYMSNTHSNATLDASAVKVDLSPLGFSLPNPVDFQFFVEPRLKAPHQYQSNFGLRAEYKDDQLTGYPGQINLMASNLGDFNVSVQSGFEFNENQSANTTLISELARVNDQISLKLGGIYDLDKKQAKLLVGTAGLDASVKDYSQENKTLEAGISSNGLNATYETDKFKVHFEKLKNNGFHLNFTSTFNNLPYDIELDYTQKKGLIFVGGVNYTNKNQQLTRVTLSNEYLIGVEYSEVKNETNV